MPSLDTHPAQPRITRLLLTQELRSLMLSPALWFMLIILSLLTGYSFNQAVELFAQASKTALSFPELASGMNPMDGVFVPTFGAYYLTETMLLPFVAIRIIGLDKQSGVLKLLLQLPPGPASLCGIKAMAMGIIWLLSLLPAVLVLFLWQSFGGHLSPAELLLLFAGHGLYSMTVICIAMFAAAVSDSLPTAAMICLAITLGSWILNFSVSGQSSGFASIIESFSFTAMLRQFENGLLSSSHAAAFVCISLLFFLLTIIWLHPGKRMVSRVGNSVLVLIIIGSLLTGAASFPTSFDVTENRRHSFSVADTEALQQLSKTLTITIHLNTNDSRLLDLENDLLAKLRRTTPQVAVTYVQSEDDGLFSAAADDSYGLIEYDYDHHHDQSYSNSQEEILPIIYKLAGIQPHQESKLIYPGYPLVADAANTTWWFYILLPVFFLGTGLFIRKKS